MAHIIIARVSEDRNHQRRVTIPKDDPAIRKGDWVEIRKIELDQPMTE